MIVTLFSGILDVLRYIGHHKAQYCAGCTIIYKAICFIFSYDWIFCLPFSHICLHPSNPRPLTLSPKLQCRWMLPLDEA